MTQSDIWVKSYIRLNFLRAFVFNFERLDKLLDKIRHPSKKLLSFKFGESFCIQFRASRIIKWLNRTSELKVIVVWICLELLSSISSVSIYYAPQSDLRVKSYVHWNFSRASIVQFGTSRYISRLNWTSELKVMSI